MIRVGISIFLLLNFSMVMTSCTSFEDSDYLEETESASDGTGGVDEGSADNSSDQEDQDLDAELESGESDGTNEIAGLEEDSVEDEISQEEAKTEKPVASDEKSSDSDDMTEEPGPQDQGQEPALVQTPSPPVPEKNRITNIRYVANSSGGTIVIEANQALTYQTRMNSATNQFVIEIADAVLPANLQRPYQMSDFNSQIAGINAYQSEGSTTARIVVQMKTAGRGEPIVQQEGNSLVVIPPAASPPVVQAPALPSQPSTTEGPREGALSARTLDEFLTGNQKFYGRPISLQVKEADVRDVVNFLAEESGANIVMSDDVAGKISIKLRRVPWDQALVTVMRTKNLGYVRQGNVLRISTLKALQDETESANKILEAQKAIVPAVVKSMSIGYANLEELVKNLTPFLSKDGKIVSDNRTSTLVVTDKEDTVVRISKLVRTLDIPPSQVSIESKVVEAQEEFQRFIGVNWTQFGAPTTLSPDRGSGGAPIDLTLRTTSTSLGTEFKQAAPLNMTLSVGTLDFFGDLTASLTLAERDSLAKVLSAPRISTMNREKATIRQEGENVTVTSTLNQATNTMTKQVQRTPFKLELAVTPQITSDGSVIMDVEIAREFLGADVDSETQARPVNKRFAKTKILVRNGQTAVIGGIFTSDELEGSSGVPGLKNIPILGWLFKNKSSSRAKNELLVFMTPRILATDLGTQTASN
jgi:type IV pilus assembly protein PilQ